MARTLYLFSRAQASAAVASLAGRFSLARWAQRPTCSPHHTASAVALVGGGNSAGQAVAFLAPKVKKLHLIVRREGLDTTMSRYLIERIAALPNVELHIQTEVVDLHADEGGALTAAVFRNRTSWVLKTCALRHLFLFIGADPNTAWLQDCVTMDDKGFVTTGQGSALPLETSRPGVFAIGDVRAGSTKRVAAAVGEGAAVVAQIHAVLAEQGVYG